MLLEIICELIENHFRKNKLTSAYKNLKSKWSKVENSLKKKYLRNKDILQVVIRNFIKAKRLIKIKALL